MEPLLSTSAVPGCVRQPLSRPAWPWVHPEGPSHRAASGSRRVPSPPRPFLASRSSCHDERLSTLSVAERELWLQVKGLPAVPSFLPCCPPPARAAEQPQLLPFVGGQPLPQPTPPGWARPFRAGTAAAGEGVRPRVLTAGLQLLGGWGSRWERGHPTSPLLCCSLGMAFPMVLRCSVGRGAWSWGQAEPHHPHGPPCLQRLPTSQP